MENTMNTRIAMPVRVLAASVALALSAGWIASAAAQAPAPADHAAMHQRHGMEHMQMKMKERIAKMAARLEIKASQQGAWSDYVKARESMWANPPVRPAKDADAATIARSRADFAADMARKLAVVSDATAKLQAVLTPEQRKVFDEMARRGGHRRHHGDRGGRGDRGESGRHGGGQKPDQRAPR
jgi:Spy/CpxP family protein refolding chaperone